MERAKDPLRREQSRATSCVAAVSTRTPEGLALPQRAGRWFVAVDPCPGGKQRARSAHDLGLLSQGRQRAPAVHNQPRCANFRSRSVAVFIGMRYRHAGSPATVSGCAFEAPVRARSAAYLIARRALANGSPRSSIVPSRTAPKVLPRRVRTTRKSSRLPSGPRGIGGNIARLGANTRWLGRSPGPGRDLDHVPLCRLKPVSFAQRRINRPVACCIGAPAAEHEQRTQGPPRPDIAVCCWSTKGFLVDEFGNPRTIATRSVRRRLARREALANDSPW
jgi:hypothetical protein